MDEDPRVLETGVLYVSKFHVATGEVISPLAYVRADADKTWLEHTPNNFKPVWYTFQIEPNMALDRTTVGHFRRRKNKFRDRS